MSMLISKWLPDAKARKGTEWDEAEFVIDPGRRVGSNQNRGERLDEENTGTSQNDRFDGWSDEAAPVKANSRRAERLGHI
jgi:hypothetical protein